MAHGDGPADAELIRALQSGDLDSLRLLYDRHAPWLSARLHRRCSDPDVVADALQDCFTAVWRSSGSWRGDGEVAAWLWGIAIRRLVSRLRSPSAVRQGGFDDVAESGVTESAEERVLLGIEYGDLGGALDRLSPEMRAVVEATVLDGLTSREAASLLGIPQNTVKTRLHRAKAQLRADLAGGTP
ncbi:RNA polymerase sigma24 factor [Knoellia sinensis KCTC 19936]|uniref:RNA polymerase sigma24 factor n=1 Tax=Knoellia sinensis KCTC 19936 TaxID=1385520 RepID=A0A0A0J9G5_9MICO|nr:RNA polymerase sigma factor [Knoellia sinensis]KGN33793.1 RNA polymerase sigma24 factor [Knoellia sinensis KCTC 19936]